jgi:hypothetical protein
MRGKIAGIGRRKNRVIDGITSQRPSGRHPAEGIRVVEVGERKNQYKS